MPRDPKGETSIKRAALINMMSRYVTAFIQLGYSVLLARILTPEDFGVVAIAQVFVTFFALFQDMGLGSAIIQRQDLEKEDISRLFAFSVALGVALGFAFVLLGIPISIVYGEERLVGICIALSIVVLSSTLNTVPNALLMKSRRFVIVGMRQVICVIVASALGIVSATMGAGPYSIVIFSITQSVFNLTWNYHTHRVQPIFRGMMSSVGKVFEYSAWLFGFNMINYFSRNTDNLLIGYFFGSAELGNYSKAYQLMQYPQTLLTSVVASVLHPMLAESQDDTDYIYTVYIRLTKALSLVGVFISVFCFFSADEIVAVLYGSQWQSSAACLRWLSVSIWSQMVCGSSGPMFQVLGRTKEQFERGLLISMATVGVTLVGVSMGSIERVAMLVGLAYLLPFVLLLPFLIRKSFNKSVMGFVLRFAPDFAMALLLSLLQVLLREAVVLNPLASVLIKLVITLVVYGILLIVTRQMEWVMVFMPKSLRSRVTKSMRR